MGKGYLREELRLPTNSIILMSRMKRAKLACVNAMLPHPIRLRQAKMILLKSRAICATIAG